MSKMCLKCGDDAEQLWEVWAYYYTLLATGTLVIERALYDDKLCPHCAEVAASEAMMHEEHCLYALPVAEGAVKINPGVVSVANSYDLSRDFPELKTQELTPGERRTLQVPLAG